MASVRTESVSPFCIYEDRNVFERDAEDLLTAETSDSYAHGCDIPVSSIEDEDSHVLQEQRRASGYTSTSISSFPSEHSVAPGMDEDNLHEQFTPMKARPAFRNPSSVKAMQMQASPIGSPITSPHAQRLHKLTTPVHRSETPRSRRSNSIRSNVHLERPNSALRYTPMQEPPRQQFPLVLLHITLLPLALPYPAHLLEEVLPEWLMNNFRSLESKLQDSTLMGRGLLIPHPRHEYDLLEERILESLELAIPRLLKSGHFYNDSSRRRSDSTQSNLTYDFEDNSDIATEKEFRSGTGSDDGDMHDLCTDCSQPMGLKGAGSGKRRWEVRIYAANGLMREGAWGAAWAEMERIDVEVVPWIPNDLKMQLETRVREVKAQELQKAIEHEKLPSRMVHGILTPPVSEPPHSRQQSTVESTFMPADAGQASNHSSMPQIIPELQKSTDASSMQTPKSRKSYRHDISLAKALLNYVYLLLQDRRNIVMIGLSFIVVFLCIKPSPTTVATLDSLDIASPISTPSMDLVDAQPIMSTQYVTMTATEIVVETYSIIHTQPGPSMPSAADLSEAALEYSAAATELSVTETAGVSPIEPIDVSNFASMNESVEPAPVVGDTGSKGLAIDSGLAQEGPKVLADELVPPQLPQDHDQAETTNAVNGPPIESKLSVDISSAAADDAEVQSPHNL